MTITVTLQIVMKKDDLDADNDNKGLMNDNGNVNGTTED